MPTPSTWYLRIPGALAFWKLWRDTPVKVADMRRNYTLAGLEEKDLAADPIEQFRKWFAEAAQALKPPAEPNAMTLATCGADGRPQARTVLLKGFDARGFTFFTNYESRKGRALAENPHAALLFHWHDLERQVEIRGPVEKLPDTETEAYFRSRPVGSRVGAWASRQSTVLQDRSDLEQRVKAHMEQFAGKDIPVPPYWGGYLLRPEAVEFWQGRPSRLHDRLRFSRQEKAPWKIDRLSP